MKLKLNSYLEMAREIDKQIVDMMRVDFGVIK